MVGTDYYVGLELMLCYVAASADLQVGKMRLCVVAGALCVAVCRLARLARALARSASPIAMADGGWLAVSFPKFPRGYFIVTSFASLFVRRACMLPRRSPLDDDSIHSGYSMYRYLHVGTA
jgi:hypothetical protein